MRRMSITIVLMTMAGLGVVIGYWYWDLLSIVDCDQETKASIISPTGEYTAVVFEMSCGATVGRNTQLSIAPSAQRFSGDEFPPVLIVNGDVALKITWVDSETVVTTIPKGASVIRKEPNAGRIAVEYR
jgi:hypothetical protein